MDRQAGWQLVCEFVKDAGLRRHMLAVEAALRAYARRMGGDEEQWGLAGLIHDFDWEVHPSLPDHPVKGAEILRQRGVDDPIIQAVLAHAPEASGVARKSPLDFALLACDEVTGLLIAVSLVRPTKDIREVEIKSVKKKWKEKSFAAGVDRASVEAAVADFSRACFDGKLELWEHVGNVLAAMQAIAGELDLDGRLAQVPRPA